MKITVKLFAMLSKYTKNQSVLSIDVAENATLKDVIKMVGIPEDEVFNSTINGRNADLNQIINDGDTVGFYPYLGGG